MLNLSKNKLGESTYTFSESKQHTLELQLGSDNKPLQPRVLVTPESRQFIDKQIVNIKNMMSKGDLYYKSPGSIRFKLYSSPIEITESGTLLVKVDQENYVEKIYEFDF